MKLAVSNIAWPAELDGSVLPWLASHGVAALEVAPTRVWPDWEGITPESVSEFRRRVESEGLVISSLQSILFQKPGLTLFGTDQDRQAMRDHLRGCADLAAGLGAFCLVFGAPKNRRRGSLGEEDAFSLAAAFFAGVAEDYSQRGVCLGFEANPKDYACDFATEGATAARLVRAVGSPGFALHLDTACLYLAGEDAAAVIAQNADILRHFHVSEPNLGVFAAPASQHAAAAEALGRIQYPFWAALEMRTATPPLPALHQAVEFLRRTYGQAA
jgi:D-psicose/D-tagatose/L-ribulose 3-epimerase